MTVRLVYVVGALVYGVSAIQLKLATCCEAQASGRRAIRSRVGESGELLHHFEEEPTSKTSKSLEDTIL